MQSNRVLKENVLSRIAHGKQWKKVGVDRKEKWQVGDKIVHIRYRARPLYGGVYSYGINPNSLEADYEVWICGDTEKYYLIPTNVIKMIYNHPDAYPDHTNPEIRVPYVHVGTHRCRYSPNGLIFDFSVYYRATL